MGGQNYSMTLCSMSVMLMLRMPWGRQHCMLPARTVTRRQCSAC
uniref:Alternative protein HACE1 n=1 Tax=Homo sapiens TaxID=9606 RepID=L8E8L5_HUMAN|nr:alternative protein HACE1 [Homo sapiens]